MAKLKTRVDSAMVARSPSPAKGGGSTPASGRGKQRRPRMSHKLARRRFDEYTEVAGVA